MEFEKYHSINPIYKSNSVLDYEVVVTEKIHGTNVRFGNIGGLSVGGRNKVIYDGEYHAEFDGYGFYDFLKENYLDRDLPENHIFYGEFFGSGIQKGVTYFPNDRKEFACFDIKVGEEFLPWDQVVEICGELGIPTVPELARGFVEANALTEMKDADSVWAANHNVVSISEGIVIKPLNGDVLDKYGNRLIAKYKNEKYKEKGGKSKKAPKGNSEAFLAGSAYCTYARVENSIDKLRQETSEELSMKHMPLLIRIVQTDVEKDADDLPNDPKELRDFYKGACKDVARHFQEWLLK